MMTMKNLEQEWLSILDEFQEKTSLKENQLIIIGCSTSEVAGEHIGTSGSEDIAKVIFDGLARLKKETGAEVAFQCCEHLNRAIVVEEKAAVSSGRLNGSICLSKYETTRSCRTYTG
jgi:uncharacterized protein (TIGR01440 family)